ncbi:fused response regulator/phosphatase [Vogesella sp. LYT5W]|uniref:Fused response regulator/phosphatase n=1 Tax=Vogesella margarita TaxID=2984199 RepID=A0ABT5IPW9_9NEIS|nr:fused response regulator/phosphatase [Vogesella margarita]MDC7714568.1 fused response regulator/phosphatase [Vogesella margarita]
MSKQLTILAVDDVSQHRAMLTQFIRELGHVPVTASNGQEAVDYCRASMPDMILMDILMPVMDGFTATRHIRALLAGRWIPIVFLSALNEEADYLHGLEAGGDDYLAKPVNLSLLSAKISSLQRVIDMQERLADSHHQLEQYYATTQQEHSLAQHVLESFNTAANARRHNIQSWLKSAVHLSGDVICIAHSPSGTDHVMLADSTGHGLVAAICCLPAIDTFHAMTQRGAGIGEIAESINSKLHQTLPIGHFVAAALLAVDYRSGSITVWNGGIPCCSFINRHGEREKAFRSAHPPLGTLPPEAFDPQQEQYRWQHDGEIIVCSDGVTEARNAAQQQFGEDGVLQAARAAQGHDTATRIATALQQHLQQQHPMDDASLVVIGCRRQPALPPAAEPPAE